MQPRHAPRNSTATRLRQFERIDGTPIVLAEFATTDDALKTLARALRFELVHDLSRALGGASSTEQRLAHPTEYLLDGALYRTESACCATFALKELNGPNVIWSDRLFLSPLPGPPVVPQQARRLARGILLAIRLVLSAARLATLMRVLCQRNGGTFVALPSRRDL